MYHKGIPLVEVNICLLADEIGIPTTDTFDFSQGVHDFALSIYIGVEETKNVLQREFWMTEKKLMITYLKLLMWLGNNKGHL